ncbi:MAG: hypothetical protein NC087_04550 [Anaeroplasma bactoclasticum]|nr:hypothetical protein [Anaeroplasma bactoclasticum]MCM1556786.1 hypothetical protein [Anaeroplasma bactoclasticum]
MINYKDFSIKPNGDFGGYVLMKTIISKKGDKYQTSLLYPSTLESAIKSIISFEFNEKIDSKDYTLKEALDELRKITNEVKNALQEFNI